MLHNSINLLRARALRVKLVPNPLLGQPPRELNTHNALTHAENLSVVAEDGPLNAEGVMRSHGPDARHLVGRDGYTEPCAANEEGPVRFALGNELGGLHGGVRVGSLVVGAVDADIDNAGDTRIGFEICLDFVLVAAAGVVGAHGDADAAGHCCLYRGSLGGFKAGWRRRLSLR